jgi:hypothetical protein
MVAMVSNVVDIGSKVGGEISAKSVGAAGIGAMVGLKASHGGGGDVSLSALRSALAIEGSGATPPESPTPTARTARAAHVVASAHGARAVSRAKSSDAKRGTDGWEIIRGSHVDKTGQGILGDRVSPILATARVGGFNGEAQIVQELRDAYVAAEDVLAPADFTSWFRAKVLALRGVPMFTGCSYLPPESAPRFETMIRAIERATGSRYEVHMIAVANTEGSIRAVCSALVEDTLTEVDEINACVTEGKGKRALAAREEKCRDLLRRLDRHADLLGPMLDKMRAAVSSAEASVAGAMLAADLEDDESEGTDGAK